jgi:dihydrofolate reductase
MKSRRKIIVYIATSGDGYIARPDGDVEWLNRRPRKFDYGMRAFYPSIDTDLWGRRTYDWALDISTKKASKTAFSTRRSPITCSRENPGQTRRRGDNSCLSPSKPSRSICGQRPENTSG